MNNNPLPNNRGDHVNMITIDEEYNLEEIFVSVADKEKVETSTFIMPIMTVQMRAPIEVEVLISRPTIMDLVDQTCLDTKTVPWNYSTDTREKGKEKLVVKATAMEMTRFAALSALVKVLNKSYKPTKMTSENLSALVGQVVEANIVSLYKDELSHEGMGYNRALNITSRYRDKFIPKVFIGNGSTVNIFPYTTLWSLEIDIRKVERLKLPRALMMVAMEMLKNGFVPSQGLGVHLDGILNPIQLFEYKSTFGLGYETSLKEVSSANLKRKGDILLPKLIQLLNQSFFKMFVAQVSEEDTEEVLIEGVATNPSCPLINQKPINKKPNLSLRVKEEVSKQFDANIIQVTIPLGWPTLYPCQGNTKRSKLKNAGATYMRSMTTIIHYMIHKDIEVYVDDVIIKSRKGSNYLTDLKNFFDRLTRYDLKLNPIKCEIGVLTGKLLGFIMSRKDIEFDLSKIKAIQDFPPPRS
ncbi:hypothetical protein FXO37_20783 [Capsicum annuum]|nr:hypothetical protein FXO37_20783 [Capsicum annuum]